MSLLNDVMRDLQTRGVLGVPPLAGLQPVSGVPGQQHKRSHLLAALAALSAVSLILLWQPFGDGGWLPSILRITGVATREQQSIPQTESQETTDPEPVVAATGDDLRELFPIEDTAGKQLTVTTDLEIEAPVGTQPELLATAEETMAEPVTAIEAAPETAPVESRSVAEAAIAEPVEPAVAAEIPPPAAESTAVSASTKPTIMRRKSGEQDLEGIIARATQSMRSHDFAKAERLLREALAIDSSDAETWSFLYGVLLSASRPAAAEQALQQGLRAADKPAQLAKLYARTLLDRGDRDAAVGVLAAHRQAPASDTEYDAFFAALLQQTGQYAEAGEIYQGLLTTDPNSGAWLVGLAMSHDSLGYRDEALIAFERALASGSLKSPLDRYARRRIAELKAHE